MSRLDEAIRARLADGMTDPSEIADVVFTELSDDEMREAFRGLLRTHVVHIIGTERRAAMTGRQLAPVRVSPGASRPRVAKERDWLSTLIVCADGVWRPLRDATYDDLMFNANDRWGRAKAITCEGDRFACWATAVQTYHVEHLGDLPADVLASLKGAAA